jgi:hypothetical protein
MVVPFLLFVAVVGALMHRRNELEVVKVAEERHEDRVRINFWIYVLAQ